MVLGYDTFHGPKLEHVLDAAPGGLAPAVAVVAVVDVGADTRQPAPPRASADPWHHLGRVVFSILLLHVLLFSALTWSEGRASQPIAQQMISIRQANKNGLVIVNEYYVYFVTTSVG